MERLGVVMAPEPDDPDEAWGVLNPASARDRNGDVVPVPAARGRGQRVAGRARPGAVRRRTGRRPASSGSASRSSRRSRGSGTTAPPASRIPRITFVPTARAWVMTYTAYGPLGPKIALAAVARPRRLGAARPGVVLATSTALGARPQPVPEQGRGALPRARRRAGGAVLRAAAPADVGPRLDDRGEGEPLPPRARTDPRPGIWVSYVPADEVEADPRAAPAAAGPPAGGAPRAPRGRRSRSAPARRRCASTAAGCCCTTG